MIGVDRYTSKIPMVILLFVVVISSSLAWGADSTMTSSASELTLKQAIDLALSQNRDMLMAEQDQHPVGILGYSNGDDAGKNKLFESNLRLSDRTSGMAILCRQVELSEFIR